MQKASLADKSPESVRSLTSDSRSRAILDHGAGPLVRHEFVRNGIAVSVVIGRPEPERSGTSWRCRVRVEFGTGRLEQSQVVGTSTGRVLRQALELVTTRLGVTADELLGGATVGTPAPQH